MEGVQAELEAARRPAANPPPVVNPDKFRPHQGESGEFPDSKALAFGFDHVTDHPGAYVARLAFPVASAGCPHYPAVPSPRRLPPDDLRESGGRAPAVTECGHPS